MVSNRDLALIHSISPGHKRSVMASQAIVRMAFACAGDCYVAFSGGKDSTCVLALARELIPEVPAVISIHKWRLPETTEYLDRIGGLHFVASGSTHGTGWSVNWDDEKEARATLDIEAWFEKDADKYSLGRPEKGTLLGLRKAENSYRRVLLRRMGPLFRSAKHGGQWLCSPIADWSTMDVWAFIHARGLDYNKAYDRMEILGVPMDQQRIGPLAVDRVLGYGQLAILRRGWPDLFNRYAAEHPEARSYA